MSTPTLRVSTNLDRMQRIGLGGLLAMASTERSAAPSGGPELFSTPTSTGDYSTTIAAFGELDCTGAPILGARLDEAIAAGWPDVVVDLRHLTFCDCAGLGVLVKAHHALAASGGRLTIIAPQPRVRRVLMLTGLDHLLTIRRDGTEPLPDLHRRVLLRTADAAP